MRVGILGSGFGLYGYLPAVVYGCGEQVLLPERYRSRLLGRADVGSLADRVEWIPNEAAMLDAADALIITQRPEDQVRWVSECLARANIKRLLLEKPLAPTPDLAASLLDQLLRCKKTVRIGYTFPYAPWAQELLSGFRTNGLRRPIELEWLFRAHHFRAGLQNWKRRVSAGGGVIRFFGIQLIALLSEIGYTGVAVSEVASELPDQAESWSATFTGLGRPEFRIKVDSNSAVELFAVHSELGSVRLSDPFQNSDPFEKASLSIGLDRRVGILTELCQDLLQGDVGYPPWYDASIQLWAEVERATTPYPR